MAMADMDLGANEFTFTGYETRITYFPQAPRPGPIHPGQEGGRLDYQGPEGTRTFTGQEITQNDGPLGTMVTVTLKVNADAGGLTATVLIPRIIGATREQSVEFETLLLKAASRGFVVTPGPSLTYAVVQLRGTARVVILPLASEEGAPERT